MTILSLTAPTLPIGGSLTAGLVLPVSETNTFVAGNTGCSFANNGAILIRFVVGSSGTGTVSFNLQRTVEGQLPAAFTQVLANSTNYIFGPFSPSDFNDVNGLVQVTFPYASGNTVGLYTLPGIRT
jgi:hypothetical protein